MKRREEGRDVVRVLVEKKVSVGECDYKEEGGKASKEGGVTMRGAAKN